MRRDPTHLTLFDAGTEFDIGPATGHVGRDRDGARLSRLRDDLRLALVVLGVQDLVPEAAPFEHARQRLGNVHVDGAHEDRQATLVLSLDLVEDRLVFLAARLVDEVVLIHAAHRPVGRDHDDLEPVDLEELGLLGLRRARHARELVVHPEVVLDGDGGQGLALLLDGHTLLRLHGLVQALRPAPPVHQAPRELVDDQDLPLLHDVVHLPLIQGVSLEQLVDDVQRLALHGVVRLHLATTLDLLLG